MKRGRRTRGKRNGNWKKGKNGMGEKGWGRNREEGETDGKIVGQYEGGGR